MKLIFIYSLKEEISEAIHMLIHNKDYRNLRSVVWPYPNKIINFANNNKHALRTIENTWNKVNTKVEESFEKLKLKDLGDVTCYVHGISCEGWFNVEFNSIHIRLIEYSTEDNLIDSIIHELIHLATYDKKLSYKERESIVDKLLTRDEFNNTYYPTDTK